jgi:hypothetical protein
MRDTPNEGMYVVSCACRSLPIPCCTLCIVHRLSATTAWHPTRPPANPGTPHARRPRPPPQDVKLENLLLDASCNLKLADFGLAIDQKFEQANTRLGTFG